MSRLQPSVRPSSTTGRPWIAKSPGGWEELCDCLPHARSVAGLPPIGIPPNPVPIQWLSDYLDTHGLTPSGLASYLGQRSDRTIRRYLAGDLPIPWTLAELLAAWADGRCPNFEQKIK